MSDDFSKYRSAATMPDSVRRAWYEAGKPPLAPTIAEDDAREEMREAFVEVGAITGGLGREIDQLRKEKPGWGAWNRWAESHTRSVVEETLKPVDDFLNQFRSELQALHEEVGLLRSEMQLLRAIDKGSIDNVVELPNWRTRNVAA
jgi:hypothetical protein